MTIQIQVQVPSGSGTPLLQNIQVGDYLYVVGANGTGKSSLMHFLYCQHSQIAHRISGHRQIWFNSDEIMLHGQGKLQAENQTKSQELQQGAIWKDDHAPVRNSLSVLRLTDCENDENRIISDLVREDQLQDAKQRSGQDSPLKLLNRAFQYSGIPISFALDENAMLKASRNGGSKFSIARLSDGERNALLLACDVLTVNPGTLLLIDEPEKHLHRSIVSPLLKFLFEVRNDCMFVVSTHEVQLPIESEDSRSLLVRGCLHNGTTVYGWDVDVVCGGVDIDDSMRRDILGARRKVLFVEGSGQSLDKLLYSLVFPGISIVSKGGCDEVEKSVVGTRSSSQLNWIEAYGLIDNDRREAEEIQALRERGVYALPIHTVESVYYHPEVQRRVAERMSTVTGLDPESACERASNETIQEAIAHSAKLAERASEKHVFRAIDRARPTLAELSNPEELNITVDVPSIVAAERQQLDTAIQSQDVNEIITRYPIKNTAICSRIARCLGFQTRSQYEEAVRTMLVADQSALTFVRGFFGELIYKFSVT